MDRPRKTQTIKRDFWGSTEEFAKARHNPDLALPQDMGSASLSPSNFSAGVFNFEAYSFYIAFCCKQLIFLVGLFVDVVPFW